MASWEEPPLPRSFDSVFYGAAGGGVELPSDDEFNRVSFLSHFDGANNGVNNAFDDGSASNHTITASGNVTQGSFSPFSRPDGEFGVDTSGGWTYWGYNSASTGALGDEDFCMESFVFINTFAAKQGVASRNFSGTGIGNETWRWEVQTNGTMTMISKNFFGQDAAGLTSSTALTLNTWHHIAAVRQNDTLTFYIDGVARGATSSGSGVFSTSDAMWNIGSNGYQTANSTSLQGTMSNFRLVVGSAVYTSNFTVPNSKLTAITNTEMLTYQSNHFVDNSADGNSLSMVSLPAVTAFGPFLTSSVYDAAVNGASAYFDGAGDYLSTASISIGTGTFSFECWVYPIGITDGNNDNIIRFAEGNNSTGVQIYITNNSSLRVYRNAGTVYTITNVFLPNQWYKLLFIRESNTLTIYVNGVSRGTTSVVDNLDGVVRLGANGSGEFLTGYMSGARLSDNARQSGNYTVETAPFTTDSNTDFLINMADGQAIDSTAQNNLTLYGTAKTSTAQKKFGTASLLLDGNSDYAVFPHSGSNDIAGGGNWAVEFFFRIADRTVYQQLAGKGTGFQMYCGYADTKVGLAVGTNSTSAAYFVSAEGGTITNDTWHHLAAVKNGTSYKLFLDGTAVVSVTSSSNVVTGTQSWIVGAYKLNGGSASAYTNGYIDDFRVSKFARYTSNFTAPSEPFADKGQDA